MSEGDMVAVHVDESSCTYPYAHGLGIWVGLHDIFGSTQRYGHLSSASGEDWALQGDVLGVEGNTVTRWTALPICPGNWAACSAISTAQPRLR